MRIPDDVIEAVRTATDIVEVIGEHLPLRQAGKRWKALCPFHTEKTPSFTVNPELQMFHCFGCGVGGNVFTFLMRHLGLTFPEAVELLGGRAGISLPRAAHGGAEDSGTGRALAALDEAMRLYERTLWERQAGERARRYLEERAITEKTAREAHLGYAMPGFDHLRNRLAGRFGLKVLVDAGLLVDREGGRPYDRFRDRLVFPIHDSGGRPVGFGARSLDGSEPKYLNSPESQLYRKRNILYGLHVARQAITRAESVWVVEGYMDVLSLRQAGLENVVAVSGTAFTDSQARTLARYAPEVVLIFDGDSAGQQATLRSLAVLLAEGLRVRIAPLPAGDDPDSLVRSGGPEALRGLVDSGKTVVDFIVSLCHKTPGPAVTDASSDAQAAYRHAMNRDARERALRQLTELASRIPDRMTRRLMAEEVSRRLMFDESTFAEEVEARRGSSSGRAPAGSAPAGARPVARSPVDRRLHTLLGLALADAWVLERIVEAGLAPGDMAEGPLRRLLALLIDAHAGGDVPVPAELAARIDDPEVATLVAELAVQSLPEDRRRAAVELLASYQADRRRRELGRLRREIRDRESAGCSEEIPALLRRVQELVDEIGAG